MTLAIDLPPDMEERLKREAERRGIEPARLVLEAVDVLLPKSSNGREGDRRERSGLGLLSQRHSRLRTIDEHRRERREKGEEERPFYETATAEEWIDAMHEWADGHPEIPDLAVGWDSRESMYEDLTLRSLGFRREE